VNDRDSPLLVLSRYGEGNFLAMFAEAGVLASIEQRGFHELAFEIDGSQEPLTHVRLFGNKGECRHLLLDACLTEVRLDPCAVRSVRCLGGTPVDLIVIYWLREQDPTLPFTAEQGRLPLQEHPGLGVLRGAFRVAIRIAKELGKDGIAALPKFFHDAAIFYRSRLFLFLDPQEQGRFEALVRDLAALSLGDASLALAGQAVLDGSGMVVQWQPGLQVMPMSPALRARFNDPVYQTACTKAFETSSFSVDADRLSNAREVYQRSLAESAASETLRVGGGEGSR
jgi:hypothetical protein